jgi:hypothetical protein
MRVVPMAPRLSRVLRRRYRQRINNLAACAFDNALPAATVGAVPFTEGVSGDEPQAERDAASRGRGS